MRLDIDILVSAFILSRELFLMGFATRGTSIRDSKGLPQMD
jgi:hypothetical protein